MNTHLLHDRGRQFGTSTARLCRRIPVRHATMATLLLDSAVAVSARCACLRRSDARAQSIYNLSVVQEALDASLYWMDRLCLSRAVPETDIWPLRQECAELHALTSDAMHTLRRSRRRAHVP